MTTLTTLNWRLTWSLATWICDQRETELRSCCRVRLPSLLSGAAGGAVRSWPRAIKSQLLRTTQPTLSSAGVGEKSTRGLFVLLCPCCDLRLSDCAQMQHSLGVCLEFFLYVEQEFKFVPYVCDALIE